MKHEKTWFTVKGMSPPGLVFLFFLLFGIGYYILSTATPMSSYLHSGGGTGSTAEVIVNLIALPGALVVLGLFKLTGWLSAPCGFALPQKLFIVIWFAAQLLTALLAAAVIRLFKPRQPPAA